jgi:hypothetical protein
MTKAKAIGPTFLVLSATNLSAALTTRRNVHSNRNDRKGSPYLTSSGFCFDIPVTSSKSYLFVRSCGIIMAAPDDMSDHGPGGGLSDSISDNSG